MAENMDPVTALEGTQAAAEDVSFAVGESFDALLTRIKAYEQAKFVQYQRRRRDMKSGGDKDCLCARCKIISRVGRYEHMDM